MICNLTIGSVVIPLAGYTGRTSETKGLQISTQAQSQTVAYIGTAEARQFWRPGSLVTASFTSFLTFGSVAEAEFYIGTLPTDLIDQDGATAVLGTRTALGTAQVETATAAGTATGNGNVTVTITSAILDGSPLTVTVPISSGDPASTWAGKVRTALAADISVSKRFSVGGSTTSIQLTAKVAAANDATLNIALANGSPSPGITPAATSANTTAGVTDTVTPTLTLYDAIAAIGTDAQGASVVLNATITGRTDNPA
jgi:hypothetical protein